MEINKRLVMTFKTTDDKKVSLSGQLPYLFTCSNMKLNSAL